jgi:sugar fermentation stimulation protein A
LGDSSEEDAAHFYRFASPLRRGIVVSRPNRFIMFVKAGRKELRCHCPTTGRLGDLEVAGLPCLYSTSDSTRRKTGYTVEAISTSPGRAESWVGINQTAANRYLEFFLKSGALSRMASGDVRREVKLGRSRIDFLVGSAFVEAKTPLMTLPSAAEIPKARPSRFDSFDRLIRHMDELRRSLASGGRAVIVLCYLYDAGPFRPPLRNGTNSRIIRAALNAERAGVERWQVNLKVEAKGVSLIRYFKSKPYA